MPHSWVSVWGGIKYKNISSLLSAANIWKIRFLGGFFFLSNCAHTTQNPRGVFSSSNDKYLALNSWRFFFFLPCNAKLCFLEINCCLLKISHPCCFQGSSSVVSQWISSWFPNELLQKPHCRGISSSPDFSAKSCWCRLISSTPPKM